MQDFNRKLLKGWAISIVVVAIMVFKIFNTNSQFVNNLNRERQLERKQNNPLGYKDKEIVEKILVDKGTNKYDYDDILEDKDEMKSYYIVVWSESDSVKNYQKVSRNYFKTVHPGDTWDGNMTTSEEENDGFYYSTDRDEW